jgi:hypothetical protein
MQTEIKPKLIDEYVKINIKKGLEDLEFIILDFSKTKPVYPESGKIEDLIIIHIPILQSGILVWRINGQITEAKPRYTITENGKIKGKLLYRFGSDIIHYRRDNMEIFWLIAIMSELPHGRISGYQQIQNLDFFTTLTKVCLEKKIKKLYFRSTMINAKSWENFITICDTQVLDLGKIPNEIHLILKSYNLKISAQKFPGKNKYSR